MLFRRQNGFESEYSLFAPQRVICQEAHCQGYEQHDVFHGISINAHCLMTHFRQRGVTGFFVCLQPAQEPWLLNFPTKASRALAKLCMRSRYLSETVYTQVKCLSS